MSWQAIDFQGVVSLDTPVIDLLNEYLELQENQLSQAILHSLQIPTEETFLKFSDALEIFGKKCSSSTGDVKAVAQHIDKALWKYADTLEDTVTELFQQLDHIGLEQWHSRLPEVVSSIKEILQHKIEDLIWGIKRLDDQLWKFGKMGNNHFSVWQKIQKRWTSLLDRNLITNLEKTLVYLKLNYHKFMKRYGGYVKLQEDAEKSLEKLDTYPVIQLLEKDSQNLFKKLYELLKLWEMNKTAKAVPTQELALALRHALSTEKAQFLFKDYYKAIKNFLFNQSRAFKVHGSSLLEDSTSKDSMQMDVARGHEEILMLGSTLSSYRDFLLRSESDPYFRSRLGISEWVVGPEPTLTKPFLELGYEVEHLDELCGKVVQALKKSPTKSQSITIADVDKEIQDSLQEMAQPLATRRIMRSKAETVLDRLEQLDEWGAFSCDIVDYVGQVMSKLLRADWKYHVLFDFPSFQQLYANHEGLVLPVANRAHFNRLQKFTKLLNQIQDWVARNRTQSHHHDIELDMNDIKGYLQDFLAYVQRISQDPSLNKERVQSLKQDIAQELLEYRYLFGNFFYHLRQNESEGRLIRRQFLFVDQYFDSIELKLQDIQFRETETPHEDSEDK